MEKFIVKETEKAICVEARFENTVLESERNFKIWIPKSCLEETDQGTSVKGWFLQSKIKELFGHNANYILFTGLKVQKEVA